jgi:hypothetical protein
MELEITRDIYDHKYRGEVSYDAYLGQVEHGLDLLNSNSTAPGVNELEDMNKALEYNMEIMLKHLM